MSAAVQIPLKGLPLDPFELAALPAPERGKLYGELKLDPVQVAVSEDAVRLVIARKYGRRS
jgi:hypothetical protein